MAKRINSEVSVDQMANFLDVKSPNDYMDTMDTMDYSNEIRLQKREELVNDSDYEHSTAQEIDDIAEEFALKQEEKFQVEDYEKYCDAIIHTFSRYLSFHNLQLETVENRRGSRHFVKPADDKNWKDAVLKLILTINGFGFANYSSISEFIGSDSPKESVMKHLHWLKRYSDVYGEWSPRLIVLNIMSS